MKTTNLIIPTFFGVVLFSASAVFAQDKKMDMKPMPKDEMNMAAMHKDGHHT
jgi:hypothetical protein